MTSFRMLPRARLGLFLIGPVLAIVGLPMVGFAGVVIGLAVGVGLYKWSGSWGCTLTEDAIIVDAVAKHRIPWPKVQAVSYVITRLSTAATIIDDRGKVWVLRAPAHSAFAPDPLLRTKMTEIESMWKAGRGDDWRQFPEIAAKLPIWQRTQ